MQVNSRSGLAADQFCKLTIKNHPDHQPLSAKEAILAMRSKANDFNLPMLNKFFMLFEAQPVTRAS